MTEVTSYVVAGERRTGDEPFEVTSPFDGSVVARVEAARATSTFRWAAETIRAMDGEALRLDTDPALGSRLGIVRRFPYGPVAGIAPFNFPVNLVAHKMAPALAVGAPIVVKPATKTPLGALFLGELFRETDLPKEMLSVVPIGGGWGGEHAKDGPFNKMFFPGTSSGRL